MFGYISSVSMGYWLLCLFYLFLFPLISLVVAGFVSLPIIWITNKLKRYPVWSSIILVLVVALLLAAYMYIIISFTSNIDFTGNQDNILSKINIVIAEIVTYTFIFGVFADGIMIGEGWWWKNLAVLGVTILF